ncbi:MAG: uncharacterized protein QOG87_1970 [Actinomycetota bacterium]
MRTPRDMPRPRLPRPNRRRVGILVIASLAFFLLTSLRGIASFYTDYLWFDEVGFNSVWRGVLGAKVLLAAVFTAVFFAGMWASLTIADRVAPRFRPVGPEDELVQRYREAVGPHAGAVRTAVSALFALIFGLGVSSQWQNWILFQNATSFGEKDAQFSRDIGFFVFRLPFLSFLVNWLFVALVIITFVTIVAHYLNGGIRLPQASLERVTAAVKTHVSVLLALMALVKAAGYWLQRFELSMSTRGAVDGPTFTDVNAQLPAIRLLIFISVIAFVLFLINIFVRGWLLPGLAVGLWVLVSVLAGGVYPAFIQKFRVEPAEVTKERPYIQRNIAATTKAFGMDKVEEKAFNYSEDLGAADLQQNAETIRNVRLWDPRFVKDTYQRLQEIRSYYRFNDVDVDRYKVRGEATQTQTIVSARELNPDDLPSSSWVNTRLSFTHGYGAVISPANAVTGDGQPDFLVKDVPPVGEPEITQPRIYYGEQSNAYAIVGSKQREIDFQSPTGRTETSRYAGKGGVPMNSLVRRFAFALRFGDINPLISNLVTPSSRAMYVRDISERVRKAAPFLRYDADPYPVVLNGRIMWVQDAFTSTSRYPYSQRANTENLPATSGLNTRFNYVRNSVKVTIDAYDGTLKFYVWDETDPIIKAYQKAFPSLFTSKAAMSTDLKDHLRYPEDLFRVQTNMYGRYHITDPADFYNSSDAWTVAQDPGSGPISGVDAGASTATTAVRPGGLLPQPTRGARMDPTYLLLRLPEEENESFLILRPFVPVSSGDKQQNLSAFMTAKSDPAEYGKLQVFVMPRGEQIDGPTLVNSRIQSTTAISREISLLNTENSRVMQGNVLVVPIKNSLLYIRPLYVQSNVANPLPELRKVVVVFGKRAVMGDTLQQALQQLFGDAPPTLEQQPGAPTPTPGAAPVAPNVQSLLQQAADAFKAADDALRAGDLAGYQAKVKQAQALVEQAAQASGQTASTTTTTRPAASA